MGLDDIQKHIDKAMNEQNNRSIPEFEGYSPFEMHQVLHFTFGADSPIKLQKLSDPDYKMIPILNLVKYLTDLIAKRRNKTDKQRIFTDKNSLRPLSTGIYEREAYRKGDFEII